MLDACGRPQTQASGPSVVRTESIDGSATLSVHGVASRGRHHRRLRRLRLCRRPTPPRRSRPPTCRAANRPAASAVHCPDGVQFILVDAEGGADTVHIEASVPADVQVRIDGGTGADALYGGPGNDILEAGDDSDPDLLDGGPGDDGLIGARTDTPTPFDSGKSTLIGGEGSDLLVGGDPCDGDTFDGGPGSDTASFVRFNPGVTAEIGGAVTRAGGGCTAGPHLRLDRGDRGLRRPRHADRRQPRQHPDGPRRRRHPDRRRRQGPPGRRRRQRPPRRRPGPRRRTPVAQKM